MRYYMHTASLGRRDGLISALVTTASPRLKAGAFRRGLAVVTSAEKGKSLLTNDAVCISRTNIYLKRQNQTAQ